MIILGFKKKNLFYIALQILFLVHLEMWADKIELSYEEIIKKFMSHVLGVDVGEENINKVEDIFYGRIPEDMKPYSLFGINYKSYEVNSEYKDIFYRVAIAEGDDKVFWFRRFFLPGGRKIEKKDSNQWDSNDEKINFVKPLLEYLNIKLDKDFSISEDEYSFCITKDAQWEGIPVRGKGFDVVVTKMDGKLDYFHFVPPVKPRNQKPEGKCPEAKIIEVAKKWVETHKNWWKERPPYVVESVKPELVIAPGSIKGYGKGFFYCWEVMCVYWDREMMMDGDWIERRERIWIDPYEYEVFEY